MNRLHLIKLRNEKGLSLRKVGELTGINFSRLSYIEKGLRKIDSDVLKKLSKFYEVDYATILGDESNGLSMQKGHFKLLPVIADVSAGIFCESTEFSPDDERDYVLIDVRKYKNCVALKVDGESMEPKFKKGEILIVDTKDKDMKSGDYVIARYNGECVFKQYVRDGGQDVLMPVNRAYKTFYLNKDQEIELLGIVKGVTSVIRSV